MPLLNKQSLPNLVECEHESKMALNYITKMFVCIWKIIIKKKFYKQRICQISALHSSSYPSCSKQEINNNKDIPGTWNKDKSQCILSGTLQN